MILFPITCNEARASPQGPETPTTLMRPFRRSRRGHHTSAIAVFVLKAGKVSKPSSECTKFPIHFNNSRVQERLVALRRVDRRERRQPDLPLRRCSQSQAGISGKRKKIRVVLARLRKAKRSIATNGMTTAFRGVRSILQEDRGAALVEAAMILPIFLALVGGVYDFGFFLYQDQLVTSGVDDAARYLALSPDPTSVATQSDAKNLAVTGLLNGGEPRVRGWSRFDVTVSIDTVDNTTGTYSGGSTIRLVTVSTSFPAQTLGFLSLLHLSVPTISASHRERVVGGSAPPQG